MVCHDRFPDWFATPDHNAENMCLQLCMPLSLLIYIIVPDVCCTLLRRTYLILDCFSSNVEEGEGVCEYVCVCSGLGGCGCQGGRMRMCFSA